MCVVMCLQVPVLPLAAPALPDIALDLDLARDGIQVDYTASGFLGQGAFATVRKATYQ